MSSSTENKPDPVAMLDGAMRNLETERAAAIKLLAGLRGVEAEQIAKAVKTLDDKLTEVRNKRAELAGRLERTTRLRELTAEAAELKKAQADETDPDRKRLLAEKYNALVAEGAVLVAQSKQARGAQ